MNVSFTKVRLKGFEPLTFRRDLLLELITDRAFRIEAGKLL